MNNIKQYDVLELHNMDVAALSDVAAVWGVFSFKSKQGIIRDILELQQARGTVTGEDARHALSLQSQPQHESAHRNRVYLVAKVSGLPPAEVAFKYEEARKIVEAHGYEAVIPTECVPAHYSWHQAMRELIPIMLRCDAYTLIDEPHTTAGGLVEDTIANWVQLPKLAFSKI